MYILVLTRDVWERYEVTSANSTKHSDAVDAKILFASRDDLKATDQQSLQRVFEVFQIPMFLHSRPFSELNGFFGGRTSSGMENELRNENYWCRFVIKQTGSSLRLNPSFVRHDAPSPSSAAQTATQNFMPLHGKTTENYGWEWYEMLFVVTRGSDSRLTIACFDVPKDLQLAIHSDLLQLARDKRKLMLQDPHAAMAVILHQIIVAYDRSVWAIRDHICEWEAARPAKTDYTLLHEISRHAIHVSETLEVAARSCRALLKQRNDSSLRPANLKPIEWTETSDSLHLVAQVVENLWSRSEANKARVQNELALAFHLAAQRDSRIQLHMSENMEREAVAMKNLTIVALAFLPITLVSVFAALPSYYSCFSINARYSHNPSFLV
ncbi:hypothetical protein F5X97DRAFT_328318 [Nemania serpens]|nr:hypothetical protein F5X97DRAFT_328318 [Nemania serpens]